MVLLPRTADFQRECQRYTGGRLYEQTPAEPAGRAALVSVILISHRGARGVDGTALIPPLGKTMV